MTIRPWMWGLLAVAAACSNPDIEGLYQVTSHVASEGCGADLPVTGPPYFRITTQEFLGADLYLPQGCDSTVPEDCAGLGFLTFLSREIDAGYDGESGFASNVNGSCSLTYSYYAATLDGDVITYRAESYGESIQTADCDADLALQRGRDMPCLSREVIVGTRVK